MASHAALASSRIPTNTRLPSKTSHTFPAQCSSKRLEVAEFSGLRSSSCLTYASKGREASFFDAVAAQLTPKTSGSTPVKGETVAKLKVAINGFGRIGRNFLRCWHGRKDSPLEVIVVNDSGGFRNAKFPTAMASSSIKCLQFTASTWKPNNTGRSQVKVVKAEKQQNEAAISRRSCANILITWLPAMTLISASPPSSEARERRNKKVIPLEDYSTTSDGLKYYDLVEGKGPVAEKGSVVQVHFDCLYRGITAVSSRESKILAGNRIIAQPYIFKVGAPPGKERKREFVDNKNGLFSAQAAPKPPRAMYSVTEGMKVGGKRTVIVPPEAGYGPKGMNEIPPGATFELNLELLKLDAPS